MTDEPYRWSTFDTRFARFAAAIDGEGRVVRFWLHADNAKPRGIEDDAALAPIRAQVEEYCAGTRRSFDLDIHVEQGSDFERAVWKAMSQIPYGETVTYGAIAKTLGGGAEAARAVGAACNANPTPLIVPCHRVIGSNGKLTGYAGGIDLKEKLLAWEHRLTAGGAA